MSIDAAEYAQLASDSYIDRSEEQRQGKEVNLNGIKYTVLAVTNNPKTDYQGTVYQRVGTNEVIIAHRGTESFKDGMTDAGMVFRGRNNQLDDAVRFTEEAIALAKQDAAKRGTPPNISITGHSLGGTLAEITAARTGLHAETFNAYGPGALTELGRYGVDVRAQHPNIVNHVRATDVVGAGGPHLGEVHTYAAAQDIERLRHGRYIGHSLLPANPLLAADVSAHGIGNFLPNNKTLGDSILSPNNEARARAHAGAIAHYRDDVVQGRIDLHTVAKLTSPIQGTVGGVRLGGQVLDAVHSTASEKAADAVVAGAKRVGHAAEQAYDATRGAVVKGAQQAERAGEALRDHTVAGAKRVGHAAEQAYDATRGAVVKGAQQAERAGEALRDHTVAGAKRVGHAAEHAYDATRDAVIKGAQQTERVLERAGDKVESGARRVGETLERASQKVQEGASRLLDKLSFEDTAHPGHGMFKQAQAGMQAIDAQQGRASDRWTDNAAGAVALAGLKAGMTRIDHLTLNGERREQIIAVQGTPGSALSRVAMVDTAQAVAAPLAHSAQAFAEVHQDRANAQEREPALHRQAGPVLA